MSHISSLHFPLIFCLFTLPFWASISFATEPILRINTEMHTASITDIAADAAGRYLVTTSRDKTAKVWELSSGRLLNTLRPPQDVDNEGLLYATAMSPDGNTVAMGGWTMLGSPEGGDAIYIFERTSGRLLRRLSGLPNVVSDLAWSPDGHYLAAGVGGKNGIRLYRADTWQQVGSDTDYGDSVASLDFSRDGKLVSTSKDGNLRLYRADRSGLRLLAQQAALGGKQPYAVRFSPNDKQIAVGFSDVTKVDVLDGRTLDFLFAPEASYLENGGLPSVNWSNDGQTLLVGGSGRAGGVIRRWTDGGHGAEQQIDVANHSIEDVISLPNGNAVFCSGEGAWGVVDASGQRSRFVKAEIADFRSKVLQVSRDGKTVGYSDRWLKTPTMAAIFNLQTGLSLDTNSSIPLATGIQAMPDLTITDWKGSAPKLNGTPLNLMENEGSRSFAIAPDGESFVLGTEWYVRLFDRNGTQRWKVVVPSTAWAVNISGDGRYVVAAIADGTIRWYGMGDGKEKLAFFPHTDRKRWVAWTPSGYYTASPGGEELIGWHLNNGKDAAADFFPASRFRNQFHRPDVLAKVLEVGNETEALRLANEQSGRKTAAPVAVQNVLPPVLSIVSPGDSSVSTNSITVRYQTRSPDDAPVTAVRARVNGQAVSAERALKRMQSGDTQEITVSIPSQDSEIQLFAENKNGVSTPATLRLTWAGKQSAPNEAVGFAVKPKLYVLAVGVSKYDNPDYALGFAAKDAKDFASALQKQKNKLYREVEVKLLTDKQANRDNVVDGLDWLKEQVTQRDIGMLFLAGHGINDAEGKYYYLPVNADVDRLKRTGVVFSDIKDTLANLAGKALFFIDTCHSGNVLGGRRAVNANSTDAVVNELASAENGVVVFSSSTGKQFSLENDKWGNGAFTKALIEGLGGKADYQKNGRITHKQLDFYLSERVKELTGGKQTPVSQAPGGVPDFPVAVVK